MILFLMIIDDEKTRDKLEEIYIHYHKELFIVAYSILKDYHEAEDIVHNAILKLSNNIDKIFEIKCKKTRAYLVIIVRNLCYNAYNRKKGISYLDFDKTNLIPQTNKFDFEEHIARIEKHKEIAKQLAKLHKPYADILTLRFYHQLSISEIAMTLEITENNASVRINRALHALQDILEEGGISLEKIN